jgi:DNA-binding MarR family transcriptional regulator
MSKQAGQKKGTGASFLQLYHYMLRSPAWRSLSPTERATYLEISQRFNGSNNGEIAIGIREMEADLNVGKSSVQRAIEKLVAKGFIEKSVPSNFNRKDRTPTEYRLTSHYCNRTGKAASKAFMKWTEIEKVQSHLRPSTVPPQEQPTVKEPEIGSDSPSTGTVKRSFGT